jgi:hypothetical protein
LEAPPRRNPSSATSPLIADQADARELSEARGTQRGEGIYRIASGKPKYRDHYQNKTVKRKSAA